MINENKKIFLLLILTLFIISCEKRTLYENLPEIKEELLSVKDSPLEEISTKEDSQEKLQEEEKETKNQETTNYDNASGVKKQEPKDTTEKKSLSISGTFRCWSYNVQGAGKSCTSPPLVLNEDKTYSMSSEKGTYLIEDNKILLSESKIRGSGSLLENNKKIRFEYEYNGWQHIVTYVRFDEETPNTRSEEAFIQVKLTIQFPYDPSAINTVQLRAQGEETPSGETLLYPVGEREEKMLEAVFRNDGTKSGILSGKTYEVYVSSGFSQWKISSIDLQNTKTDTALIIKAKDEE